MSTLPRPLKWPPIFPLEEGLVLWLPFDDRSGARAIDHSGKRNHGSISGLTWVAGHRGSALRSDGINEIVTVGISPSINNLTPFTCMVWLKPELTANISPRIIEKVPKYFWLTTITRNLNLQVGMSITGAITTSNETLPLNIYSHVAALFDVDYLPRLLLNGTEVTYSTQTQGIGLPTADALADLQIGNSVFLNRQFRGNIASLSLYNRALSVAEIKRHCESELPYWGQGV